MPVHEAWVLGALIMLIGLCVGFPSGVWWARRELDVLLDDEYDRGYNKAADDAWQWSEPELLADYSVERRDSGELAFTAVDTAGHTVYTELTALDVQDVADEVAEAEAAVDPDWHPAFLARSDAWLAEWRANLGLQEAA